MATLKNKRKTYTGSGEYNSYELGKMWISFRNNDVKMVKTNPHSTFTVDSAEDIKFEKFGKYKRIKFEKNTFLRLKTYMDREDRANKDDKKFVLKLASYADEECETFFNGATMFQIKLLETQRCNRCSTVYVKKRGHTCKRVVHNPLDCSSDEKLSAPIDLEKIYQLSGLEQFHRRYFIFYDLESDSRNQHCTMVCWQICIFDTDKKCFVAAKDTEEIEAKAISAAGRLVDDGLEYAVYDGIDGGKIHCVDVRDSCETNTSHDSIVTAFFAYFQDQLAMAWCNTLMVMIAYNGKSYDEIMMTWSKLEKIVQKRGGSVDLKFAQKGGRLMRNDIDYILRDVRIISSDIRDYVPALGAGGQSLAEVVASCTEHKVEKGSVCMHRYNEALSRFPKTDEDEQIFKDEAEYCAKDVICLIYCASYLTEMVTEFVSDEEMPESVKGILALGADILFFPSLASFAYVCFRRFLFEKKRQPIGYQSDKVKATTSFEMISPRGVAYTLNRAAIYGGSVQCLLNGQVSTKVIGGVDIVSLYPRSITAPMPYGEWEVSSGDDIRKWNMLFVNEAFDYLEHPPFVAVCELTRNSRLVPKHHFYRGHGVVPYRLADGTLGHAASGVVRGVYTSFDLNVYNRKGWAVRIILPRKGDTVSFPPAEARSFFEQEYDEQPENSEEGESKKKQPIVTLSVSCVQAQGWDQTVGDFFLTFYKIKGEADILQKSKKEEIQQTQDPIQLEILKRELKKIQSQRYHAKILLNSTTGKLMQNTPDNFVFLDAEKVARAQAGYHQYDSVSILSPSCGLAKRKQNQELKNNIPLHIGAVMLAVSHAIHNDMLEKMAECGGTPVYWDTDSGFCEKPAIDVFQKRYPELFQKRIYKGLDLRNLIYGVDVEHCEHGFDRNYYVSKKIYMFICSICGLTKKGTKGIPTSYGEKEFIEIIEKAESQKETGNFVSKRESIAKTCYNVKKSKTFLLKTIELSRTVRCNPPKYMQKCSCTENCPFLRCIANFQTKTTC